MNDDLSRYEADIDLSDPNISHSQVADLVGQGQRVLDLGCWTGDLGAVLKARGCTVTGIEVDEAAAEKAGHRLDEVVVADLDTALPSTLVAAGSFDVVLLADVLEHLADPRAVLADAARVLAPGGRVVASVPNVTHGSLRLALLEGRWSYTDTGLLDATHRRFFDRAGVLALFHAAELTVSDLRATLADPLDVEVRVDGHRLPANVVEWVRDQPDALVYQFVVAARVATEEERAHPVVPELDEPVPADSVRLSDRHTERAQADIEERHRILTMRDHIIGLEAAAATAQFAAEAVERKLRGATKRLNRKNVRIKELSKEVRQLQIRLDAATQGAAAAEPDSGWRRRLGRPPRP